MIRVQVIDGVWQTLGSDLYPGVKPQGVVPTWGPNGPESLSFTLARPPHQVHADLLPFTPVEWYPTDSAAGDPLWSGYTMQAPPGGYGESTSVSCVGWHFYREDDPISRLFVHEDLTEWTDSKTIADDITNWGAGLTSANDTGGVVIGCPQGTDWPSTTAVGVTFDAGPTNRIKAVALQAQRVGANASVQLFVRGHADLTGSHLSGGGWEDTAGYPASASSIATAAGGSVWAASYSGAWRYVSIFLYNSGATYTATAEDTVRISAARVFADTAYWSGSTEYASVFRADTGIKALRPGLPLLSSDETQIETVSYAIRHAAWIKEDATRREMMDRLNDYHGYRLGVDASRRVFFKAQPSLPRLQVNRGTPGVVYRDASTNDGSEVYNKVSVRGKSGSGVDLRVDRWLAEVMTNPASRASPSLPVNGTLATDVTGWTNLIWDSAFGGSGDITALPVVGSMTGALFKAAQPYLVSVTLRGQWLGSSAGQRFRFGSATDYVDRLVPYASVIGAPHNKSFSFVWVPSVDVAAASVSLTVLDAVRGSLTMVLEASVALTEGGLLTKRARSRSFTLNVGAPTDVIAMEALARAWLLAHRSVPHKAQLTISADDVVTDLQAGQPVAMGSLGRYYGEMVRVLSTPDPDTGAVQSRDGIVASVQGTGPVSLALDSERRSLEALMVRMGVVQTSA